MDLCIRSASVVIITIGTVYIFITANGDIMRILMAFFNLTLFAGFGLMSLSKAYDFTKEQHTAWMKRQTELENAAAGTEGGE
jgi:multisubunit Na+/H+ antiporter MnhG subunit